MAVRKIVIIDEELCDGCGACIPYCAEGAIQIIDGKAKLIRDDFCDGLGACLGECPRGAIDIEEREANEFDEEAVKEHLEKQKATFQIGTPPAPGGGCPSARPLNIKSASALSHWPVKLKLVPPQAPFLNDADLILLADCVPITYPNLHADLLPDHVVVIGCPKFDDYRQDLEKLTAILAGSGVRSLKVVVAEVPCCRGYDKLAREAVSASGRDIPVELIVIGLDGEVKRER
jgi:Pyruvate/2-oxoacid:ferredoxin oxidoreductase delta subunit